MNKMTIETIDDLAKATIKILEQGWTQHTHARDANNDECAYNADDAVCWCLLGAIGKVRFDKERPPGFVDQTHWLEWQLLDQMRNITGSRDVVEWQDSPGRTVNEVISMLRDAAEGASHDTSG